MLKNICLAAAALLLSGCLTTPGPVFDETNSLPLGEMPEFMAFVEAWESFAGSEDSPRQMIADGGRGLMVDGILVIQDKAEYYSVAVIAGRPLACVIYADQDTTTVAASHGVTVVIDRSDTEQSGFLTPLPVKADGPPDALLAFIRDQFANQALACNMPKRGGD